MKKIGHIAFLLCTLFGSLHAQDTFSIVALDSTSREVGSAGASCLDLDFAGYADPSFLTRLLPDTGAVNIQSYFMQLNQDNAVAHLRLLETPTQVITWLVANDANNNPEFKQHGIVAFNGNTPSSASHTGSSCITYAGHRNGSIQGFHYAIQGNILLGPQILDSMESRFRNTQGNLACRLMAAMQGANVVGADTRCTNQGLSSKFAFLQVAKPSDSFGNPYINVSLKTTNSQTIEPIDSLQNLLNAVLSCSPADVQNVVIIPAISLFPNPVSNTLYIQQKDNNALVYHIHDLFGRLIQQGEMISATHQINVKGMPAGLYAISFFTPHQKPFRKTFLIQ